MTEHEFSRKLVSALRRALPEAEVEKYNDRRTKGLPDISVTYDGRTTWLESKIRGGEFPALQFHKLLRRKRGWYVVYNPARKNGHLVRPLSVFGEAEFGPELSFEELFALIIFLSKRIDP